MKILHVVPSLAGRFGGMTVAIAKHIPPESEKVDVTVLSYYTEDKRIESTTGFFVDKIRASNAKFIEFPMEDAIDDTVIKQRISALFEQKNILPKSNKLSDMIVQETGACLIRRLGTTYKLKDLHPSVKEHYEYAIKTADRANITLCSSNHVRNWCVNEYGFPDHNLHVIYNGLDINQFNPDKKMRSIFRKKVLGVIDEDIPIITNITRFGSALSIKTNRKDPMGFMIGAAVHSRMCPAAHYVMCGAGLLASNTELIDMLKTVEQEIGTDLLSTGKLHLLGFHDDIKPIYWSSDVIVSCPIEEGFGLTLIEAMAAGISCVVTDCGELPDMVDPTGKVVPVRPVDSTRDENYFWGQKIADAFEAIINRSPEEKARYKALNIERIKERFDLERETREYIGLYETLIEQRKIANHQASGYARN
jgi:glycosyltransferase involved in cell wall biosynthesis